VCSAVVCVCCLSFFREQVPVTLPKAPSGRKWCRLVDTNLPAPKDFTPGGNAGVDSKYGVAPHSAIVLITKPC